MTEVPGEHKDVEAETPVAVETVNNVEKPKKSKKKLIIIAAVALLALLAGAAVFALTKNDKPKQSMSGETTSNDGSKKGDQFSTDPVEKGKYLSGGSCQGTGSKKLGSAPMNVTDLSIIEPYGLVAGGHVTPVDHQYYWGKIQRAAANTYDVLAPGDGNLVSIEVRPKATGPADVRGVISYSCTFFSYFDLANSLSPELAAKMPSGWEKVNGPQYVNIPVKQGQVVAKVGGQSLDYAVWDTTKTLPGLLVAKAYNNTEPWKVNTVEPNNYYTDAVKAAVAPYYVRSVAPIDGKLDYDIDGMVAGNWFKKGTNGYIGAFKSSDYNPQSYADGHLSIAPDFLDPTGWVFSTGAINHGSQYTIKLPSVTPDKVGTGNGMVKYQLSQLEHVDQNGVKWLGATVPKSIKLSAAADQGTVLVQLTAKRELKVEVFMGKTLAQVSAFTDKAITYTRGDDAGVMSNNEQMR